MVSPYILCNVLRVRKTKEGGEVLAQHDSYQYQVPLRSHFVQRRTGIQRPCEFWFTKHQRQRFTLIAKIAMRRDELISLRPEELQESSIFCHCTACAVSSMIRPWSKPPYAFLDEWSYVEASPALPQ